DSGPGFPWECGAGGTDAEVSVQPASGPAVLFLLALVPVVLGAVLFSSASVRLVFCGADGVNSVPFLRVGRVQAIAKRRLRTCSPPTQTLLTSVGEPKANTFASTSSASRPLRTVV